MSSVKQIADANLPTRWGHFRVRGFEARYEDGRVASAVALVMGDINDALPLTYLHAQCMTGEIFSSLKCNCREHLEFALALIAQAGAGVLLYQPNDGRGGGFVTEIQSWDRADEAPAMAESSEHPNPKVDRAEFQFSAHTLKALGLTALRLISDDPQKAVALDYWGIRVVERISLT